jgi:hypothetical protein
MLPDACRAILIEFRIIQHNVWIHFIYDNDDMRMILKSVLRGRILLALLSAVKASGFQGFLCRY